MLRSGASRSILRSLNTASPPAFKITSSPLRQQLRSQLCTISRRPQIAAIAKPLAPRALVGIRGASSGGREPVDKIDQKREEEIQKRKLRATPETVSQESTVMPMTGTPGDDAQVQEDDPQMMAGIKSDLVWHTTYPPCEAINATYD